MAVGSATKSTASRSPSATASKVSSTSADEKATEAKDPSRITPDGTGQAATGQQPAAQTQQAQQVAEQQARDYTVKSGDNLTHIAKDNGLTLNELLDANPSFKKDPNRIFPGQELKLPPSARGPTPEGNTRRTPGDVSPGTFGQPVAPGNLARGATGPVVTDTQNRLNELGFNSGRADGVFGPVTQNAVRDFQSANNIPRSGIVNPATRDRLASPDATRRADVPTDMAGVPQLSRYAPNSPEAIKLFSEAAKAAGLPESWGSSPGLHNILRRESDGQVGRPNYTYGARARDPSQWGSIHSELQNGQKTAKSSATGLGQLLLANVDKYYPNGRAGIGDPMAEATGMLNYIKDRYGTPDRAWALYGTRHEGY